MLLVTGPTGSGKSTTLYATLNIINRPEVNIITVEDPVEYRLAGVSQVQTNWKAGFTFASALRSILRSDPDIVLIGEIRDHETAQIAIEAALTGHLVLTTLHTNDAIQRRHTSGRDGDRAVPGRFGAGLCPGPTSGAAPVHELSRGVQTHPETLAAARFPGTRRSAGAVSLERVRQVRPYGISGAGGLHEVMQVSETLERMAVERATTAEITSAARPRGCSRCGWTAWPRCWAG